MSRVPLLWWALIVAGNGALVLFLCGPVSYELVLARELFILCLGTLAVMSVTLFRQGRARAGALVIIITVALLVLAAQPIYVKHWVPDEAGGSVHWHALWDLGHVH